MSSQPIAKLIPFRQPCDRRVAHVLELLQAQPSLRSNYLAKVVNLTPSHLGRLFKAQTGVSIGELSLDPRLERSKRLLETTFQSMKEIRHEAGIPDASNFVRYFTKKFGMSPFACRERANIRFDQ